MRALLRGAGDAGERLMPPLAELQAVRRTSRESTKSSVRSSARSYAR